MSAPASLQGKGIVVTRPLEQADSLCRLIEAHGGTAIRFPTLEIVEPRDPAAALAVIDRLDEYQMAIFTSANAVGRGLPLILARRRLPSSLKLIAIGQATARALERHGAPAHLRPEQTFTTEALLELPDLQAVAGLRIVIVRGEGGRGLLGETLARRGARVSHAEVYRRTRPALSPEPLLKCWRQGKIQAVVVTSNESLQNLFAMVGKLGQHWLCQTPLVVVSTRARQLALELGFRHPPRVAGRADDQAIVEALLELPDTTQPDIHDCGVPL